ncbi:hypothetical protein ACB094_02G194200 [Castanea mollissima]
MHSPWYNSCNYHFLEGESMRVIEKMPLSCISSYYMTLWILFRTLHGLLVPCF